MTTTWYLPPAKPAIAPQPGPTQLGPVRQIPDRPIQTAPILGWGDTFGATFEQARIPSNAAGLSWGQGAAGDLLDEMEQQAGIDGGAPPIVARGGARAAGIAPEYRRNRLFYIVETARAKDPRAYPGLPASREEFDAELGRRVKEQQDELAKTLGQQPEDFLTARILGGVTEFATRPSTVLSMPLNVFAGPETGLARFALGQAGIGAGQGALDVVDQTNTATLTGDAPPTAGEAAMLIGEGAAMNSVLGVGMHLLPPAVIKMFQSAKTGAERGAAYIAARSAATGQAMPPGVSPAAGADAIAKGQAALNGELVPFPEVSADAPAGWDKIRNGIFAGESGGDYNALFAYQNRPGGAFEGVKLTDMTVDEALAFSDPSGPYGQWVNGQIGRVATPMGAYQIVGTTLRAAKKGLGLVGDERMTPELQERLGQWIYRQQGTGAWEGYQGPRDTFTPGGADGAAPVMPYRTSRGYTAEGQVAIGENTRVNVHYEVVDAGTLSRASGDLQPRDRTRAASDAWIADTAARLDPAQLMPAATADKGAPLVGPDSIIESGNGRVAAIERAYAMHPDRIEVYKQAIEAAGYKIPEGVERPVLIARRTSELSPEARRQAVIDAQDSGVAQMTPTEVARASARAMTPDVLARMDPARPITDSANADFLRSALNSLPRSARNAMFEDSGALNKLGQMQMAQALFARAWPDPAIIARYAETAAGDLRGLLDALEAAAPQWAALRADIEAGRVNPDMDISGFVLDAMRIIAAARDVAEAEGIPTSAALADLVAQVDMEFGAVPPLTEALIAKFWRGDKAAPKAEIGKFLSTYAEDARKTGGTNDMLAAGPRDVLAAIDPKTFGALPEDLGEPRLQGDPAPAAAPGRTDYPAEAFYKGASSPEAIAEADALKQSLGPDLATRQGQTTGEPAASGAVAVPDATGRTREAPSTANDQVGMDEIQQGVAHASAQIAANPDWGKLTVRSSKDDPGTAIADLLDDIEEDLRMAQVIATCNPGGAA
jgi:hypothetical protein